MIKQPPRFYVSC